MAFYSPPPTFSPELCSPESSNSLSGGEEVRLASNNPKKPAGRKKFTETRHPVYRGIRRKNSGRWVCELREPTKQMRIWLGTFPTPEMAARAYDVAAIALRGKSACVNFADSFSRLRIPDSTDPKVIQKAAAAGAEAFRPPARERYAPSPLGRLGDEFNNIKETEECGSFTNQQTDNETGESASSFWSAFEDGFFDMEDIGIGNPGPIVSDDFENYSDLGLWDY